MTGNRILIAEDEKHIRLALSLLLRQLDFEVETAKDGEEALHKLLERSRNGRQFDLLITDIRMPRLDGVELIDQMSLHEIMIPVIAITGYGDKELARDLEQRKCAGYIDKPFIPEELLKCVENALSQASPVARAV